MMLVRLQSREVALDARRLMKKQKLLGQGEPMPIPEVLKGGPLGEDVEMQSDVSEKGLEEEKVASGERRDAQRLPAKWLRAVVRVVGSWTLGGKCTNKKYWREVLAWLKTWGWRS